MNRFLVVVVLGSVACAGRTVQSVAPLDSVAPPPEGVTSGEEPLIEPVPDVAQPAPEGVPDSVADVAGIKVDPEAIQAEAEDLFGTERTTWDIDVESFQTHERVQFYLDHFTGASRERFTVWLGRMSRYEAMIRSVFRSKGLPEDLVYLALIESGYSNIAVSRARAVGMWQFIASTGRRYGLTIDAWVDERRDPFRATEAAANYLVDLSDRFGSYYLAAAAYNAGEGRITRGLARLVSGTDSLTDETFFELASHRRLLHRETRDYVPKLIAAALIAKQPGAYGFDSVTPLEALAFEEITIQDATGLDVLAELADTTLAAIVELNPQFIRGVTPPQRTVVVRVPERRGAMVAERYADLPPEERVNQIEHVIRRGETLGELAKHYGVTVSGIVVANPGIRPRALRVGQRIAIPTGETAAWTVVPEYRVRYHRVRRGETMSGIAYRYGIRLSSLLRANGMRASDLLRAGRTIRIPAR